MLYGLYYVNKLAWRMLTRCCIYGEYVDYLNNDVVAASIKDHGCYYGAADSPLWPRTGKTGRRS